MAHPLLFVVPERRQRFGRGERFQALRLRADKIGGIDALEDLEELHLSGVQTDAVAESLLRADGDLPADTGQANDRVDEPQDPLDLLDKDDHYRHAEYCHAY